MQLFLNFHLVCFARAGKWWALPELGDGLSSSLSLPGWGSGVPLHATPEPRDTSVTQSLFYNHCALTLCIFLYETCQEDTESWMTLDGMGISQLRKLL